MEKCGKESSWSSCIYDFQICIAFGFLYKVNFTAAADLKTESINVKKNNNNNNEMLIVDIHINILWFCISNSHSFFNRSNIQPNCFGSEQIENIPFVTILGTNRIFESISCTFLHISNACHIFKTLQQTSDVQRAIWIYLSIATKRHKLSLANVEMPTA